MSDKILLLKLSTFSSLFAVTLSPIKFVYVTGHVIRVTIATCLGLPSAAEKGKQTGSGC